MSIFSESKLHKMTYRIELPKSQFAYAAFPSDRRTEPDGFIMTLCTAQDHATPCIVYKVTKKADDTWEHTSAPVADSIASTFKNCLVFADY